MGSALSCRSRFEPETRSAPKRSTDAHSTGPDDGTPLQELTNDTGSTAATPSTHRRGEGCFEEFPANKHDDEEFSENRSSRRISSERGERAATERTDDEAPVAGQGTIEDWVLRGANNAPCSEACR